MAKGLALNIKSSNESYSVLRQYIQDVVKYCKKPGNERLVKSLVSEQTCWS